MPVWLTIVLQLGGSAVIASVVGIIIKRISDKSEMKRQRVKDLQKEHAEHVEADKQAEFEGKLLSEVRAIIAPMSEKINNIDKRLTEDREATVVTIRAKMKGMRDQYIAQGYADSSDKATWNELYKHYRDMGGNHFKEYVDQWKTEVDMLPLEKIDRRRKTKNNMEDK